jgi:hypothetical protein
MKAVRLCVFPDKYNFFSFSQLGMYSFTYCGS